MKLATVAFKKNSTNFGGDRLITLETTEFFNRQQKVDG